MELLSKLRFALRMLRGRRQADAELEEEVRFHIDNLVQQHIAEGKSPEKAQHAAMREFGVYSIRDCRWKYRWRLV